MSDSARQLRDLLAGPGVIVAPGAFDALSAKIVESVGFRACYMTGFGAEASVLGRPDLGYLTLTEAARHAGAMARAISIPLIADADVGYGGPLNVERTVYEFEARGVAGIQIEDQVFPKHCGLVGNVEVLPRHQYLAKIRAATQSRRSADFLIIARTDAYESLGFEETVERANECAEIGADMIFVAGASTQLTAQEREELPQRISVPLFGTIGGSKPAGKTAALTSVQDAEMAGLKIAAAPLHTLFAASKAMIGVLRDAHSTGDYSHSIDSAVSFDEFDSLIGLRATLERGAALESN